MSTPDPFETTHWSLILAARDRDEPRAREALAALRQSYWSPVHAYSGEIAGVTHRCLVNVLNFLNYFRGTYPNSTAIHVDPLPGSPRSARMNA